MEKFAADKAMVVWQVLTCSLLSCSWSSAGAALSLASPIWAMCNLACCDWLVVTYRPLPKTLGSFAAVQFACVQSGMTSGDNEAHAGAFLAN